MVICLKQGADCLHMVQLMPLPSKNPTISCLIKIQKGFIFVVLNYSGCLGKKAVRRVFDCLFVLLYINTLPYLLTEKSARRQASILKGAPVYRSAGRPLQPQQVRVSSWQAPDATRVVDSLQTPAHWAAQSANVHYHPQQAR